MPLPTCECVDKTIPGLLAAIYCALYEISQNGGGGGSVTLADITDMSDFWKATLSGTPVADRVFGTDGAGVFTTFDGTGVAILITGGDPPANGFAAPPADITVNNGIVTSLS
jgi:hypothetical protein